MNVFKKSFFVILFLFFNLFYLSAGVIDNFDSVSWNAIGDGIELSSVKGFQNKALCLSYNLEDDRQWVVISKKNADLKLPANFEISFYIKGTGRPNNLEFKLIDKKGNVFWKKWDFFVFPAVWQKVVLKNKDIAFAWGPDRNAKLSKVDSIEIAVSRGRGGSGKVCFDQLTVKKLKASDIIKYTATASASQEEGLGAQFAVDGNKQTRWSSPFSDPQWLKIDMGKIIKIGGLTIYWENAYGKEYDILVSSDNNKWIKVYTEKNGDGKTDEILFKKINARYVKILGKKRATAWGYSIWEVEIKDAAHTPDVKASSYSGRNRADRILDGNKNTEWKSKKGNKQWLKIDLKEVKGLGGIIFYWGKDYARDYNIYTSFDNKKWEKVKSVKNSNGDIDKIFFEKAMARFIKIELLKGKSGKRYSLKEIIIKGGDEALTPQKLFETAAEEAPKGYYPRWLYKEQAFWTITGVTEDIRESLICEDGSVEPLAGNFSIVPFLEIDGKFITWNDVKLKQSLEEKYLPLPAVEWKYKNITLNIRLFTSGKPGKSVSYIWYKIYNSGKKRIKGKLYLALRPFQVDPPWQPGGGMAVINRLNLQGNTVNINNKFKLISFTDIDDFGAIDYKHGEIVNEISKHRLPAVKSIRDEKSYASGAVVYNYNLKNGETKDVFAAVPLHKTAPEITSSSSVKNAYKKLINTTKKFWHKEIERIKIDTPEQDIVNTLKANIAYILINRDKYAIQPGSRSYEHAWIRDGSLTCSALLKVGITKEVREYLDWYVTLQKPNGEVPALVNNHNGKFYPNGLKEYDAQGELIFIILQYYYFTGNKKFLKDKFPAVVKSLKYLEYLRNQRLSDKYKNTRFYGILPNSVSHEGYFPEPGMHSYWDDFFALKGWKDGIKIAEILGRKDMLKWMKKQYKALHESVYNSIRLTIKEKHIDYIPGCAEKGDFDSTSTAIAVIACGETENLPQRELKNTFNRYFQDILGRLEPGWKGGFTPYEIRSMQAFLYMDEKEKALKLLDFLMGFRRPPAWNHFAEVVFSNYRLAQYIGDMPHTWVGSGYINAVRSMFVFEKEKKEILVLGAGVNEKWLNRKKGITVENLPTFYGTINYTMVKKGNSVIVKLKGTAKPAGGFILKSPFIAKNIKSVSINGKLKTDFTKREVHFKHLPANIVIKY